MKCRVIIDRDREEEIIIYAHERDETVEAVEKLAADKSETLIGFSGKTATVIDFGEVYCFNVEDNKVYALTEKEKLQLKIRLYQVEEKADERFIKINQSCIANIRMIKRFDCSISGTLRVTFKNGYTDYVSRRQLKAVKERLGL